MRTSSPFICRAVQGLCLLLFCLLLGAAEHQLSDGLFGLPADIFLRLDPLVGVTIPLAARAVIGTLLPAVAVIALAMLAGRLFCGWVCPMGATLDAGGSVIRWATRRIVALISGTDPAGRKPQASHTDPVPRFFKYLLLGAVLTAAVLGANMTFWVSPIPLVTRLYALVLHPLALLGADAALATAEPLLEQAGVVGVPYWYPSLRGYATARFVAAFWLGLLVLEAVRPRFWCRYLCPAGALLGLASRFARGGAFWKRRTATSCNACGRCAAVCPAGMPHRDASITDTTECLTCRACEGACTKKAVHFGCREQASPESSSSVPPHSFSPSRRALLGAAAVGGVLAGAASLAPSQAHVVRPPGSVPESDFLARCVRCGQCMKACPSGGLQPLWLQEGFSGMFSPFLDPRSGPCAPDCAACGNVCPSRAILSLPLQEKRWAKVGTAVVDQRRCLAWAEDKRCMVCQETCPYGAISVVPQTGRVAPVPVVRENWCYGCGYCERHCPTATASIRVKPAGALRQPSSAFERTARAAGLELEPARRNVVEPQSSTYSTGAPPGFLEP